MKLAINSINKQFGVIDHHQSLEIGSSQKPRKIRLVDIFRDKLLTKDVSLTQKGSTLRGG